MRTIYLHVEKNGMLRKVSIDMAFLAKHNLLRLPRYYYEDGLYFLFMDSNSGNHSEKYYLTKDKIKKEDNNFYYFPFPFKMEQVVNISI